MIMCRVSQNSVLFLTLQGLQRQWRTLLALISRKARPPAALLLQAACCLIAMDRRVTPCVLQYTLPCCPLLWLFSLSFTQSLLPPSLPPLVALN